MSPRLDSDDELHPLRWTFNRHTFTRIFWDITVRTTLEAESRAGSSSSLQRFRRERILILTRKRHLLARLNCTQELRHYPRVLCGTCGTMVSNHCVPLSVVWTVLKLRWSRRIADTFRTETRARLCQDGARYDSGIDCMIMCDDSLCWRRAHKNSIFMINPYTPVEPNS